MCLRNNHQEGLLNGQTWEVARCRDRKKYLELALVSEDGDRASCLAHRACFDGDAAALDPRSRRAANEFDYGYALTVHKSQGSAWEKVLVLDEWRGSGRAQWLYTALTRAAESVTVVV